MPPAFATSRIFASGPTSVGRISPCAAASTAPASAVSSHGWATAADTASSARQRSISASYLPLPGRGLVVITSGGKGLRRFDEVVAEVAGDRLVCHLALVDIEAFAEVRIIEQCLAGPLGGQRQRIGQRRIVQCDRSTCAAPPPACWRRSSGRRRQRRRSARRASSARDVSKQPPWSIATSTSTEPGCMRLTMLAR